jgi:fatty acid-binding protein DegV
VIAAVRRARQEVRQWFVVDTREYLRRGGRIGGAAAWLGSALDLKPILMTESEFKPVERVRTRTRCRAVGRADAPAPRGGRRPVVHQPCVRA